MLLGISIIVAAFSYLLYRHPPTRWSLHAVSAAAKRLRGDAVGGTTTDDQIPPSGAKRPNNEATILAQERPSLQREASETQSPNATPKTRPAVVGAGGVAVPSISLATGEDSDDESEDDDGERPPPSFPALNSAQRASSSRSTLTSSSASRLAAQRSPATSQLMPPPPRLTPASLRAPSNGLIPDRGQHRASTGLLQPQLAPVKTPNPRNKVTLQPGHSSLDWANLLKSGQNLSGVSSLIRVTPSMLKYNNGRKGRPAWSAWQGKVYNMTPFLPYHPGGEGELIRAAGKNGEKLFMEVHPWVSWENMLGECLVGIMVGENDPVAGGRGDQLDQLD